MFAVAANRSDQWRQLNALTRAWAAADPKGPKCKALGSEIAAYFGGLTRLEHCWAYPGTRLLGAIEAAIEERNAASTASCAASSAPLSSRNIRRACRSRAGRLLATA